MTSTITLQPEDVELKEFSEHEQGDSSYNHTAEKISFKVLGFAAMFTFGFSLLELLAGVWADSLALIGDAGHMATDTAALVFALVANVISRRGADYNHSFGHGRIEVLAAFFNCLAIFMVVIWLLKGAVERLSEPVMVNGGTVAMVAAVGLIVNVVVALTLSRDRHSMNTRAALANVLGDMMGSIAALVSGLVIYFGGPEYNWVDPVLSLIVCALLVHAVWSVFKDAIAVLLDAVPAGVSYDRVGETILAIPGVLDVHDLHIWTMAPGHAAITAHVRLDDRANWSECLRNARAALRTAYKIDHITLQPELTELKNLR